MAAFPAPHAGRASVMYHLRLRTAARSPLSETTTASPWTSPGGASTWTLEQTSYAAVARRGTRRRLATNVAHSRSMRASSALRHVERYADRPPAAGCEKALAGPHSSRQIAPGAPPRRRHYRGPPCYHASRMREPEREPAGAQSSPAGRPIEREAIDAAEQ